MLEIIQKKIPLYLKEASLFKTYFDGLNGCVFDIETTGLRYSDYVILNGFGKINLDNKTLEFTQIFASDIKDEKELLIKTADILNETDYIVTFNGKTFDMPFIKRRCQKYGIALKENIYNFDIFILVKSFSPIKDKLPNLKQKTVEQYLGIGDIRSDEISGKESVEKYFLYTKTKDENLKNEILLHNADDIVQLSKLIDVISHSRFDEFMFKKGLPHKDFLISRLDIFAFNPPALYINGFAEVEGFTEFFDDDGFFIEHDGQTFSAKQSLQKQGATSFLDMRKHFLETSFFSNILDNKHFVDDCIILQNRNTTFYRCINMLARELMIYALKR